jgi:hypothetical protein
MLIVIDYEEFLGSSGSVCNPESARMMIDIHNYQKRKPKLPWQQHTNKWLIFLVLWLEQKKGWASFHIFQLLECDLGFYKESSTLT